MIEPHHPPQPQSRYNEAPGQIKAEIPLSIHQSVNDSHDHKIRRHGKCHADDRQDHAAHVLPSVISHLSQHPGYG